MKVVRYNPSLQAEWDHFVSLSRNATFLHKRGYMDYHSDRFEDSSLLFYSDKGALLAILPANIRDNILHSHQGLTYGGVLFSQSVHTEELFDVFRSLKTWMSQAQILKLRYKRVPFIYHQGGCDEELYVLRQVGGVLVDQALSLACNRTYPSKIRPRRKQQNNRAIRLGYHYRETHDYSQFWNVLTLNLQEKYGANPVHSLAEIDLLKNRFPAEIRCFEAVSTDGQVEAGVVVYETATVAHLQYTSSTHKGRNDGAVDFLVLHLMQQVFNEKEWFDFGTSQAEGSTGLQDSLVHQKEGFGARGILHEIYEITI